MTGAPFPGSRAAALALLGGLGGLAWVGLVQPLAGMWIEAQDTRTALAAELTQLAKIAGRRPGLEASLRQLTATLADPALLWPGASGPAVSAAIHARLREIAGQAGAAVQSVTDLPPVQEHDLSRITLHLQAEATVAALQAMLLAIESARPALFVDAVAVNAPESAPPAPVLSVLLDVTGFRYAP